MPRGEKKSIWMVIHDKVYDVTKFLDEVRALDDKVMAQHGFDVFSSIPEEWTC